MPNTAAEKAKKLNMVAAVSGYEDTSWKMDGAK